MSIQDFERRKLIQQNAEKMAEDTIRDLESQKLLLVKALREIAETEVVTNWAGAVFHLQSIADEALKALPTKKGNQ